MVYFEKVNNDVVNVDSINSDATLFVDRLYYDDNKLDKVSVLFMSTDVNFNVFSKYEIQQVLENYFVESAVFGINRIIEAWLGEVEQRYPDSLVYVDKVLEKSKDDTVETIDDFDEIDEVIDRFVGHTNLLFEKDREEEFNSLLVTSGAKCVVEIVDGVIKIAKIKDKIVDIGKSTPNIARKVSAKMNLIMSNFSDKTTGLLLNSLRNLSEYIKAFYDVSNDDYASLILLSGSVLILNVVYISDALEKYDFRKALTTLEDFRRNIENIYEIEDEVIRTYMLKVKYFDFERLYEYQNMFEDMIYVEYCHNHRSKVVREGLQEVFNDDEEDDTEEFNSVEE